MEGFDFTVFADLTPYVRMTQKGKYGSERAQKYMSNQEEWKDYFQYLIVDLNPPRYPHVKKEKIGKHTLDVEYYYPIPDRTPFRVELIFTFHPDKDPHYCDLDNLVKAIMDAGNKILYWDDRWCDSIVAVRQNADMPFAEDKKTIQLRGEYSW